MRCKTARRLMMEKLYGEISSNDDHRLEQHLHICETCLYEWDEVQLSHQMMASLPDDMLPLHLEKSILESSRQLDSVPERSSSGTRKYMAVAAVFLLLIGGGLFYRMVERADTQINSSKSDSSHQIVSTTSSEKTFPGMKIREKEEKNTEMFFESTEKEGIIPTQIKKDNTTWVERYKSSNPERLSMYAFDQRETNESKPKAELETEISKTSLTLVAKPLDEDEAEELFRTDLKLYNKAFTKIGDERNAILTSAIIYLRDMEKLYPTQLHWIALGKILIADAHRELGETSKAVKIYRQMISDFPELETYCKQARISIVHLLMDSTGGLQEAEKELDELRSLYPASQEFAQLAFTYAGKVQDSNPEKAFEWCRYLIGNFYDIGNLSASHPTFQKVQRLAVDLQQKILEKHTIRDWLIAGPFPMDTDLDDLPDRNSKKWQRPFEHAQGEITLNNFMSKKKDLCAFVQTSIYSPEKKAVNLHYGCTDGLRIWLNGEPVYGYVVKGQYRQDMLPAFLKKGWNSIIVKTYHFPESEDWRFSIRFMDPNGWVIPDLKYDPTK